MRFFAVALFFFGATASLAQAPEVPHKMQFAGMTLIIRDDARREIQKDVDAFTKSQKYFNIKVERAKTYFPIIERVFAEERLPEDFKYLVLQESALVPDAVSVSDAVGFWQFKDFTAREMGLRVDKTIDERMNIVSASRGAAKYLKQCNYYFNNWIYALQSYQMGAGGVQRSIGEEHHGVSKMNITSETYWYVKKFLAYKVAFENAIKGEPQVKVKEYPIQYETSVEELSRQLAVNEQELRSFNRWIKGNSIPGDKTYSLVLPAGVVSEDFDKLTLASSSPAGKALPQTKARTTVQAIAAERKQINGIWAVKAIEGEKWAQLSARVEVPLSKLLRYNDLSIDRDPVPGEFYYIERKKSRADQAAYTVQKGDDWWSISQQFGVSLKKVRKFNPNRSRLVAGDVVWLAPVKALGESDDALGVQETAFDWSASSKTKETASSRGNTSDLSVEKEIQASSRSNEEIIHEVKPSDTLYSVARQYNVTIQELMDWNNKSDFSLAVGERLKVKSK